VSLGEQFETFERFALPSSSVVKQSKHSFWTPQPLEMKALQSFVTSVTTCLVRQHYMPEDLNPQQHHFEIPVFVFSCKKLGTSDEMILCHARSMD
jgi:hypothetical protein